MSYAMTNSMSVTLLYFCARQQSHQSCLIPQGVSATSLLDSFRFNCAHLMTNSMWVTLLYFFAIQFHQSCLTLQQGVCDTHCLTFFCQSHQSCLITEPTLESEWHCFIFLARQSRQSCLLNSDEQQGVSGTACPDHLINHWHVSSNYQQDVSDTTLSFCQTASSHPMTNSMWVTLLNSFAGPSHQSCLIPTGWPPGCKWHCCLIFLPDCLINHFSSHDQQDVRHYFISLPSHQLCLIPWLTGCEWDCLPDQFINHVSFYDWQGVSDTALSFVAVSSIMFHPMTNRGWVTLLYFFASQSHQSCVFYHQQDVCNIAFSCCPPASPSHNQQVVSLMKFYKANPLPLILWPPVSEWHAILSCYFPSYGKQLVSQNAFYFHQTSHFISCHNLMINSRWMIQYLWITLHLIAWATGSE